MSQSSDVEPIKKQSLPGRNNALPIMSSYGQRYIENTAEQSKTKKKEPKRKNMLPRSRKTSLLHQDLGTVDWINAAEPIRKH